MCKTQKEFRQGDINQRSRDAKFRHQKKRLGEHLIDLHMVFSSRDTP